MDIHESTQSTPKNKWQHRSPYTVQTETGLASRWRGKCLCGKVIYCLKQAKPLNAKYCHCRKCQVAHAAPFQWAAIFHKHDMSFTNGSSGLNFYSSTHQSTEYDLPTKVYCENCHTPIMDEGRNMCLIFPQLIELGGSINDQKRQREPFKPTCHIFYESRVLDIPDGLPKWRGMDNQSDQLDDQGNLLILHSDQS